MFGALLSGLVEKDSWDKRPAGLGARVLSRVLHARETSAPEFFSACAGHRGDFDIRLPFGGEERHPSLS